MSFLDEVKATAGGEHVLSCIQCGTCTGTCPVAPEMDYPVRKTIAMIRAGLRDEVLSSSSMWYCVSCYLCTDRCPRGVKPTELAHALESLAVKHGYRPGRVSVPAAYRSFSGSAKRWGRVHELTMMLVFYLRTNILRALPQLQVALSMLLHRRLPLKIDKSRGVADMNRVIKKYKEIRGES